MPEGDPTDKRVQTGSGKDYVAIAAEKARVYGQHLLRNPAGLHDPKVCNLVYGAFQGSEGDYTFHQRFAMERIAAVNPTIILDRPQPTQPRDHAQWFLESVLAGDADSARYAVFSRLNYDYPPGEVFGALRRLATERGLPVESVRSVCAAWRSLEEHGEHRLPYLANGEQAKPQVVFARLEPGQPEQKTDQEVVRVGEPLPEHYQKVLDRLRDIAPDTFQTQARQLAYCFTALDSGRELVSEDGQSLQAQAEAVADSISKLPSILIVYLFEDMDRQARASQAKASSSPHAAARFIPLAHVSSKDALPHWVQSRVHFSGEKTDSQGVPHTSAFYERYAPANGERSDGRNGTYYHYKEEICPPRGETEADIFKGYIERDVPEAKLEAAFKELAERRLHPHTSKLFEGERVVLYWDTYLSDEISQQLIEVLDRHGIPFRGFSQDSVQFEVDESGEWKFDVRTSGDHARGEGGGGAEFNKTKYTPESFFTLYLQQMFRHCRNPLNPYRMSFVPVVNADKPIKNREGLQHELDLIEQRGLGTIVYEREVPWWDLKE